MIVADAKVVVTALFGDGMAREIVQREQLHAPHLIDSEVAHVLRARVRRQVIDATTGWDLLHRFRWLAITRHGTFACSIGSGSSAITSLPMTRRTSPSPRRCSARSSPAMLGSVGLPDYVA